MYPLHCLRFAAAARSARTFCRRPSCKGIVRGDLATESPPRHSSSPPSRKQLFVRNVPPAVTAEALSAALDALAIRGARVTVPVDRQSGNGRGFAFISFDCPAQARRATGLFVMLVYLMLQCRERMCFSAHTG